MKSNLIKILATLYIDSMNSLQQTHVLHLKHSDVLILKNEISCKGSAVNQTILHPCHTQMVHLRKHKPPFAKLEMFRQIRQASALAERFINDGVISLSPCNRLTFENINFIEPLKRMTSFINHPKQKHKLIVITTKTKRSLFHSLD